ncbi:transcriptional regulator with XRE-family HTH domain [Parabacteroides sp. PFB2-10]|uniref:helix-turn-helix domain-containing protein n=1 Tax=Parabacteroides sp. PFB2-10 TaxID=1742405 RepID=UPI002475A0EE|nr:helix-turn-helix transcriptional regulator [Parabacteroides sp. PFB2-10]MDH6312485.1 transcriptional regulator with XRE-family HTH domain [Parabacteroides sp. PFB2-10]
MYRIKELAKEKGMTLTQLAELVETTQPNLSAIINEKSNPTMEMIKRIATALGVGVAELFEQAAQNVISCPHCGGKIKIVKE